MSETLPRIFLVDDEKSVTDSLSWMLDSVKLETTAFNDPDEFLDFFNGFTGPACIVLDMRMPGMSGLEVLQHVVAVRSDVPVALLSAHGDVPMAVRSMKLGASDFLEKPFEPQLFLDTINSMLRRARELHAETEKVRDREKLMAGLSSREVEVLDLLRQGRSSKEIGNMLDISPKTVDIHRANILKKLKATSYRELIQMCI